MATTSSGTPPREPRSIPDRVAIETPRGNIRAGDVVDVWMVADAGSIERWYAVEIAGSRYRVPAAEAKSPIDDL